MSKMLTTNVVMKVRDRYLIQFINYIHKFKHIFVVMIQVSYFWTGVYVYIYTGRAAWYSSLIVQTPLDILVPLIALFLRQPTPWHVLCFGDRISGYYEACLTRYRLKGNETNDTNQLWLVRLSNRGNSRNWSLERRRKTKREKHRRL